MAIGRVCLCKDGDNRGPALPCAHTTQRAARVQRCCREEGFPALRRPCHFGSNLLDYANSKKKSIIVVTGDSKTDGWLVRYGRTVSPRPELVQEMLAWS
jgi:hypothetical protein